MDKHDAGQQSRNSCLNTWRAGCGGSRTSGSEGGPGKPTSRKADRAPRPDPYTKLKSPATWTYYYLYAILDVFSRYIVGWTVQQRESGELAKDLIGQATTQQQVTRDTLTVHADRGSSMTSKPVAFLLADLGVTRTHNRPYTSSDNPYSEAHFKTLKYRPAFPARFGSIEEARAFCRQFFDWYNHEHRHSGIGLMAPAAVHYGRAKDIHDKRACVLAQAYERTPERFVARPPRPPELPTAAWINKPDTKEVAH